MKEKIKIEVYALNVKCLNCGHRETIEIPKGLSFTPTITEWGGRVKPSKKGELIVSCINCGCPELIKEE